LLQPSNSDLEDLTVIDEGKLRFLSECFDQIIQWASETLESTPPEIRRWLRTHSVVRPDPKQFKISQERATLRTYVGYFKQLIYYAFRTGLLDDESRERHYGVHFTQEQQHFICEIYSMLPTGHEEKTSFTKDAEDAVNLDLDEELDNDDDPIDEDWDVVNVCEEKMCSFRL